MGFYLISYPIQIEFGSSPIKFLNLLGQWCVLKNDISSFFGEHQSWSIDVCIGYVGHGWSIHYTNSFQTMNLETSWVHYGPSSGSHGTTARGVICGFAISSNPFENFFIRVNWRPWRYLTSAEFIKCRLTKDLPSAIDGFHPFLLVLRCGKIVHSQRRFGKGSFTFNFYRTTGIGKHWSEVDLVTMSSSWSGPIVADRQRQKMKH